MKSHLESYVESPLPMQKELLAYFSIETPLTIFDIGSCEGEDSIRYARLFPQSRIFSVEALPDNVAKIQANLKHFAVSNVHIIPLALCEYTGSSNFHVSSGHPPDQPRDPEYDHGNKSSSLLAPAEHKRFHPWVQFQKTIEVPTDTLENVAKREGIHEIDYVHMDVQGAELKVLEGAGEMAEKIKAIWLEVA